MQALMQTLPASNDAIDTHALGARPELWYSMLADKPLGPKAPTPGSKPYGSPAFLSSPSPQKSASVRAPPSPVPLSFSPSVSASLERRYPFEKVTPPARSTIAETLSILPPPTPASGDRLRSPSRSPGVSASSPAPLSFYPLASPLYGGTVAPHTTPLGAFPFPSFRDADGGHPQLRSGAAEASDLQLRVSMALDDVHTLSVGPGAVTTIDQTVAAQGYSSTDAAASQSFATDAYADALLQGRAPAPPAAPLQPLADPTDVAELRAENDALRLHLSQSHIRLAVAEDLVDRLSRELRRLTREAAVPRAPPASRMQSLATGASLSSAYLQAEPEFEATRAVADFTLVQSDGMTMSGGQLTHVRGFSSANDSSEEDGAAERRSGRKDVRESPIDERKAAVPADGKPPVTKSDSNREPSKWLTPSSSLKEELATAAEDTPLKHATRPRRRSGNVSRELSATAEHPEGADATSSPAVL